MSMDGIDFFAVREEQRINKEYPGLLAMVRKSDPKTDMDLGDAVRNYMETHDIDNKDSLIYIKVNYLYQWIKNRIVYQFDGSLSKTLLKQSKRVKETEQLPCELLKNLPYPCIAVKTPPLIIGEDEFNGNFIIASECINETHNLSVLCETTDGEIAMSYLPIIDGGTIKDSVMALHQTLVDSVGDIWSITYDYTKFVMQLSLLAMQIVLYLQAQNADIQNRPNIPRKKKSKGSAPKIKPVKVVNVGYRVGRFLRSASESSGESTGTGSVKCPHSRRGHWHHFWTGSKNNSDERKLVLKWVAPTMIHGNKIGNTVTIMNVK